MAEVTRIEIVISEEEFIEKLCKDWHGVQEVTNWGSDWHVADIGVDDEPVEGEERTIAILIVKGGT